MGTNYYLRTRNCASCGRYEELHIGKLSHGWSFLFRIYEASDFEITGQTASIKSRAGWRKYFNHSGHRAFELYDEYGRHYPDKLAWIDKLKAPDADQIARERAWLAISIVGSDLYTRDSEGFRLCRENFG